MYRKARPFFVSLRSSLYQNLARVMCERWNLDKRAQDRLREVTLAHRIEPTPSRPAKNPESRAAGRSD